MSAKYILSFDPGTVNIAYCLTEIDTLKIVKWGLFNIKDSTYDGIATKLANSLNSAEFFEDLDLDPEEDKVIVLYEIQPRCNQKTITICGQLQMYYALEKMKSESPILKVVGYHAKHKIKYYEPRENDAPMPSERLNKLKKGHYRHKQIAIENCRRILEWDNPEWKTFFEKSSKKDDLSDSFISSLSYIKSNKLNASA